MRPGVRRGAYHLLPGTMLDDRTDALFPLPDSSAGKLLKHLVARQIPGTPIETRTADVARGASLRPADASAAMAKLADDGLILVEPGVAADAFTVTVLLAPPLEEFGITPEWGDAGAPVTAIPPAIPAPGPDGRAARPVAARTDGNSVAGRTAAAAGRSPSTAGPATT